MIKNNLFHHPYHLVTFRPWPLLTSLRILNNLLALISWLYKINFYLFLSFPCTLLCTFLWWRDITRESTFQGIHTSFVYSLIRTGIILFIISEIFFFISFFWTYFHSSLSPGTDIGQIWPPYGIIPFNPYDIPLINTIILISSGLSITWSHFSLLIGNLCETIKRLILTILLGLYFSFLQLFEYNESFFSIRDSIYGSTFFISTGFHGLHVLIGTLFLLICLLRMNKLHFSSIHHFNFEAASWYWHFVDIVWLFLFIFIYWWRF